jgi:Fur family ferric uptake transcriptional regulator
MENEKELMESIKTSGLRMTKVRRVLASVFSRSHTPLSASRILWELQQSGLNVNKTTVYREIDRLESLGMLTRTKLQDRKEYYELASLDHHHHLVCLSCERIEDIDVDEGSLMRGVEEWSKKKEFSILKHSLEFFGLCRECQKVSC